MHDDNIDTNDYKAPLPVYMRDGIPPYLQVLFSARPPLPYVAPKLKSRIPPLRGFSDDAERIKQLSEVLNQKRAERLMREADSLHAKPKRKKLTEREREALWFSKMQQRVSAAREEYTAWAEHERHANEGKTTNAYKTLIVYNLVS